GPNYGTQAYFEWQTSSTDRAQSESHAPILAFQIWPNPFNETVQFSYFLPSVSPVAMTIFDLLGRCVQKVEYPVQQIGWHRTSWQPSHLPSGIYFVQLETGNRSFVQKIHFVK
ncbi:MAG: T9SS type A sorting domain-containing protein, partial [bacterium]